MALKLKLVGFDELKNNIDEARRDEFNTLMDSALIKSGKLVQRDAKNEVAVAKGELKGNIGLHKTKPFQVEVRANKEYAVFVEEGTKPHFPPVKPLEEWALLKFGKPGLGYPVALKIAREGTEAQPFMKPALETNVRQIGDIFNNHLEQLTKFLAK